MEEDESLKLPLDQQWSHAKWSTRQNAYKSVAELFSSAAPGDACFALWAPRLKTAATDSNVIALESGLKSVAAFAQAADPADIEAVRTSILASSAEKALAAAKPSVRTTFQATCQDLVMGSANPGAIVEELVFTLGLKSPKALAAAVTNLKLLYTEFGKVLPLKPALVALPALFAHNDKNVRAEAANFAVVLVQIGGRPVVEAALAGIKPVQLKELLPRLEVEPLVPARVPRVLQHADEPDQDEQDQPAEPEELDPFDLADEINLKSKLPDIHEQVNSTKWKERKEALESVEEMFNGVMRIAPDDFSTLAGQLAKVIHKDANLMCVTSALNISRMLASGLRSKFTYTNPLLAPILDRFKEKKAGVLEAANTAADAIYHAAGLDAVLPTVCAALAHKVPQARAETSKYLVRILSQIATVPSPADLKEITPPVIKNMADSQEPVRAEAAKILAVLIKLVDKAMNPALAQLDDIRRQKVADAAEHVTIKARKGKPSGNSAPAIKPKAAAAPAPVAATRASPRRPLASSTPLKQPRPLHSTDFTPIKQSETRRRLGSPEKVPARSPNPRKAVPKLDPQEPQDHQDHQTGKSATGRAVSPQSRHSPSRSPLATIESDMLRREKMLAVKERDMIQKQLDQERVLRESAERQVMALRDEIGRLKRELNNAQRANTSNDASNNSMDNLNKRMSTMHIRDDSFERMSSRPITLGAPRVLSLLNQTEDEQRAGQVEKSHENWRRAKEVTSELRKRVEEMKRTRMINQNE